MNFKSAPFATTAFLALALAVIAHGAIEDSRAALQLPSESVATTANGSIGPMYGAWRLKDVSFMVIAGDVYRDPHYIFVAFDAPLRNVAPGRTYHVIQGTAPNIERVYYEGDEIRRHPRTGVLSTTHVYLPVEQVEGGQVYVFVRDRNCLFPSNCSPVRLNTLAEEQ